MSIESVITPSDFAASAGADSAPRTREEGNRAPVRAAAVEAATKRRRLTGMIAEASRDGRDRSKLFRRGGGVLGASHFLA
jgi:hypothetical protein